LSLKYIAPRGFVGKDRRSPARRRDHRHPDADDAHRRRATRGAGIRARYPEVGILILSRHVEVGVTTRLLPESAAGIGYLLKDRVTDFEHFIAVRRVAGGRSSGLPAPGSRRRCG
jgi:hypothetical protein